MTSAHLPAEACGPVCTCVHRGAYRVVIHWACPLHGNGRTWEADVAALLAAAEGDHQEAP